MIRRQLAAVLVAAATLLVLLGTDRQRLSVPLRDLDALGSWIGAAPAPVLACALLRQGAIAACTYLLLALTLQLVAAAVGSPRLARLARRALPAIVHHALVGGAGLGVAAGSMLSVGGRPVAAAGVPVVAHWEGGPPEGATASMTLLPPSPPAETITMRALDPTPPARDTAGPAPRAGDTWVVRPGDSFWSIAHHVLVEHGQARPTDEQVADYWRLLLRANGEQLASSEHPDLLFPGQTLEVPPP